MHKIQQGETTFTTRVLGMFPKRVVRHALSPGGMIITVVALMILSFEIPLAPIIARLFPYLVVPIIALAFFAADRTVRTLPVLLWALAMSLLAAGLIAHRPEVRFLGLDVRLVALVAGLWMIGIACLRPRSIVVRRGYPVVAGVAVISLLLDPLSLEWSNMAFKWQEQVSDFRTRGELHETELARNFGPDFIDLTRIIKEKTPESTVIAFPGPDQFMVIGNPELVNYFVYPRTIKSAATSITPVFDISGAGYVVGVGVASRNVWPVFSVPVRTYYHTQALHRVRFGDVTIMQGRETTKVAPSDLQPWQTDADRSIESDKMDDGGGRTVTLFVSASVSDPWVTPVNLPLTQDFSVTAPVTTNAGNNPAMDEQVALLAEVRGPGGETALFTSVPALQSTKPQTLLFQDLAHRATEYARARGWRPGPLVVTHVGLELGWQIPLSQTKTNTLMVVERGDRAVSDGPDTFARLASDAQRHLQAGNATAAIGEYATGLLLRPDNLDGQLSLGEAFRIAGQWKEGAQFFTSLLNDYPSNPWIRYSLAVMRWRLGDPDGARMLIAPVVANVPIAQIARPPDAPEPARARLTAVATSSGYGYNYTSSTTLRFDTGDGSVGEVYASINDGPETLEMTGPSGMQTLRAETKTQTRVTYRLYAGTDHARLLDAVTITSVAFSAPASTVWANFLEAQIALDIGDIATARATYQKISTMYPGENQFQALAALAALDRGK